MDGTTVLHSDMNSFYASVEMMLEPSLRGKAVAVCGATEERHGIILAKSEKAKRAGVKTGMVNWEAKQLCPELILVPPQYDQYLKYSKLAHSIYLRHSPLVEPFGMDECWIGLTHTDMDTGLAIAEKIRKATREELGLTVSIGVSFNKIFAKLGSDMKKPDAITVLTPGDIQERVWPLEAGELLYVGRATAAKLMRHGIHTVGQLAALSPEILRGWFGVQGLKLWSYANGTDTSRVMPYVEKIPMKSVGHGITCVADLENGEEVYKVLLSLAQDLGHRLRLAGLCATGVQLYVRNKELTGMQYQCALPAHTQLPNVLAKAAFSLFQRKYRWSVPVRAVCIRATGLVPFRSPEQLTMFADYEKLERRGRLEDTVEELRGRFGKQAVTYGILLGDLKMPGDGRELVRMPSPMYH